MIDFKNIHYDSNHIWGSYCLIGRSEVWFDFKYNRRTSKVEYCSTNNLSDVEMFILLKGCGQLRYLIGKGKLKNGEKYKSIAWG